jgi:hypothetical protein
MTTRLISLMMVSLSSISLIAACSAVWRGVHALLNHQSDPDPSGPQEPKH